MNQLQAVALNEGLRCKKRLWRERGREQLESFRLAPWASRRRRDLLELLDRLNPAIAELTQATEQEAEKCPEAQRLRASLGWSGTSSTRAKWRALRHAWVSTLEKCLTPPTLLERRCFDSNRQSHTIASSEEGGVKSASLRRREGSEELPDSL